MYVKIYYSCVGGTAIAYETYDYEYYQNNKELIHKELLSKDNEPMDLDVQLFDDDNNWVMDL